MLNLPFSGCKVLDLTQGVAGPHATMLLALNGADVIKVEPPAGDWARTLGKTSGETSVNFLAFNRGKRSVSIDLKAGSGPAFLEAAIRECDIVVESFRPGVAARLGAGAERCQLLRPDGIYVSISGFGQTGPEAGRAAVDSLIQAYSGMMVMNATPDGVPQRSGMIIVDVLTGLYAYQAIAGALIRRMRFGRGDVLDINMVQSAAAFQMAKIMEFCEAGGAPQPLYVPAGGFRTADGYITISGMRKEHFESICQVLGVDEFATDPRWPSQQDRVEHADEINARLQAEFLKRPSDEWLAHLAQAGVMAEKVRSYGEWLREPHVVETGGVTWLDSVFGRLPLARIPGVFALQNAAEPAEAPGLGQHSSEILRELGLS